MAVGNQYETVFTDTLALGQAHLSTERPTPTTQACLSAR